MFDTNIGRWVPIIFKCEEVVCQLLIRMPHGLGKWSPSSDHGLLVVSAKFLMVCRKIGTLFQFL